MRVPGSALGARGVEILGSILAFQSNGLFIGQTNRVRESEGGGGAKRPLPVACCC